MLCTSGSYINIYLFFKSVFKSLLQPPHLIKFTEKKNKNTNSCNICYRTCTICLEPCTTVYNCVESGLESYGVVLKHLWLSSGYNVYNINVGFTAKDWRKTPPQQKHDFENVTADSKIMILTRLSLRHLKFWLKQNGVVLAVVPCSAVDICRSIRLFCSAALICCCVGVVAGISVDNPDKANSIWACSVRTERDWEHSCWAISRKGKGN